MLEEKNDNLHDADGRINNTKDASDDANNEALDAATIDSDVSPEDENEEPNSDLITDNTEEDIAEPIDETFAAEGKENDDVPEDLLTRREDDNDEEDAISTEPETMAEVTVEDTNEDLIEEVPEEDIEKPLDVMFAEEAMENHDVPDDLITETPEDENDDESDEIPPVSETEGQPVGIPIYEEDEFSAVDSTSGGESTIMIADSELNTDEVMTESNDHAVAAIADTNAEESEDETLSARHDIPMKDYEAMSMDQLTDELEGLVGNDKVMSVREHVEEIKKSFLSKYHHFIDEKKQEYHAENPETTEDFHYSLPLKGKFDQLYNQYRDRKNTHFKSLQSDLKSNLDNRLAIVEELKNLINPQENIKDTLKHFNELRDRWKNAGPIPKDKYNHVWNNYHFHVENFYDYLHLDREARDIDFRHNLELKQKIITRVEQLVNEADINKAFRELQDLHKIWKEDIGPVSREHREEIWNRFSELTKQMHDKREVLFEKQRGTETENLQKKKDIIAQIEVLATEKVGSHSAWLEQIEKVEALRNAFFSAGKVPIEVNEETWTSFKNAVRDFNSLKNSFYKDIKKDQNDNLGKKQALVAKAKELQESTDFAATTPIMKQIQEEWKQVGHVPRKYSDKLWKEFKSACNHYFEKLKESRSEENAEEIEAFEKKKEYLETLKDFQLTGDHKTDLDAIKAHIESWKGFGRVPHGRRHIEGKFNKILDALFEKLSLSKKDSEMMRFSNRVEQLSGSNDTRKLDNEKIFLMRKIDEVQSEIFQLENNIQFFTSKNSKKENPMIAEVRKSIEKHKEELGVLKAKLKQLRSIKQE
jgi:hypothetical protein